MLTLQSIISAPEEEILLFPELVLVLLKNQERLLIDYDLKEKISKKSIFHLNRFRK